MLTQTLPVETLSLPLLRREVQLEKRLHELRSENQIFFFQPHTKQKLFYENAGFYYRYARTGNRFGKSEMGAAEDISFALGYRPWYAEGDALRTLGIPSHPTKGLIVTTDWDKSTEVFTSTEAGTNQGKLFKYIPKDALLGFTRNHSGAIDVIRVKHISGGVSVIQLDTVKSFKQNPLGQESSVHDWVHIDEPIPEAMYKAIIRGTIDRGGRVWFTCTPLTEPWIDQLFIPDLQDQTRLDIEVKHGDFFMMTGSTDDNPHNRKADVDRVMAQYTEEERETRRTGIPRAYSGLVYKEFNWNTHVRREVPLGWKDWNSPPADFCIRFAIDYHPRKPHHVLFIATSPSDKHYVFAEVFRSCLMSDLVADIRLILKLREPTVPGLIDPLASTPNQVTDVTALDEVLRLGLSVIPATKDPHNGILKVKAALSERNRDGTPTLVVNANLSRFLFEIARGFIWDKETNKPVKDKDDAMENFYRLCLQGLSYIEPSKSEDYVIIPQRDDFESAVNLSHQLFSFEEPAKRSRSAVFASRYKR